MSLTSKAMPKMSGGTADRGNSFILGRRAFFNNNHKSHTSENVGKNIDYSETVGKESSITYAKPLQNKSADLRIQRLRLSTIGSGSSRLKNADDKITFVKNGADYNYVNNALSRVRGGGATGPKKGKLTRNMNTN